MSGGIADVDHPAWLLLQVQVVGGAGLSLRCPSKRVLRFGSVNLRTQPALYSTTPPFASAALMGLEIDRLAVLAYWNISVITSSKNTSIATS